MRLRLGRVGVLCGLVWAVQADDAEHVLDASTDLLVC
jgi:hypothetical protein